MNTLRIIIGLFITSAIACMPGACKSKRQRALDQPHEVSAIPFDIDNLTDEQRQIIRQGHDEDTSANYIRSRPVLFQIVGTGNNANESRGSGRIDQHVDLLVYALGEAQGDRLVDYAWLEDVKSESRVWEMTPGNSVHAGGAPCNRKSVARLTLPPGEYELRYVSNAEHAFPEWRGAPPERDWLYGVTMFNMTALPLIEQRLKTAGAPPLNASLTRSFDNQIP